MQISLMDKILNEGAPGTERYTDGKYKEKQAVNRNLTLTKDILALIGLTSNEVKVVERMSNENRKGAPQAVADMYHLAEIVHRAPISLKMQIREELMLGTVGGRGLKPGNANDLQNNREQVIVNPKIVSFMDLMTRKEPKIGDKNQIRKQTVGEPKRNDWIKDLEVFVAKSADRDSERVTNAFFESDGKVKQTGGNGKKTHSYKSLALSEIDTEVNRHDTRTEQLLPNSAILQSGRTPIDASNVNKSLRQAIHDNDFGENLKLERHIAPVGSKYTRRNTVDTIEYEDEIINKPKKNSRNRRDRMRG
jgi:hypothetical protein